MRYRFTAVFALVILSMFSNTLVSQTAPAQQGDPTQAALSCQSEKDLNVFAGCWSYEMMSDPQRQVAQCVQQSPSPGDFIFCATQRRLSLDEQRLAFCAFQSSGNFGVVASCAGSEFLNPTQQRLVACVSSNRTNYVGAALCAGGRNLTPEQAVVANCTLQTGGQPYAFATCVGGQLTANELQKCVTIGIGGNGCFGNDNAITQTVRTAWKGLAGGPNSVLNNPGQLAGGQNSIINNPGQIFGGPNSVFNNPSQLVPSGINNLGTVGGHRICLPWC
jgi:hypothetical protein